MAGWFTVDDSFNAFTGSGGVTENSCEGNLGLGTGMGLSGIKLMFL